MYMIIGKHAENMEKCMNTYFIMIANPMKNILIK